MIGKKEGIRPVVCSIGISIAAAVAARIFLMQTFADAQEGRYYAMASGILGSREAALSGQSRLLGRVMRLCYSLTGAVPWYTLMLFGGGAAALAVVCYILCAQTKHVSALLVQIVLSEYFAIGLMGRLSSVTAACALTTAGMMLLYHISCSWRTRFPALAAAGCALLAGRLLHPGFFQICFWGMAAAISVQLLVGNRAGNEKADRSVKSAAAGGRFRAVGGFLVTAFAILVLTALVNRIFDTHSSAKEWYEFRDQAELAADLHAYGLPEYEENRELYQDLGISRDTWRFFHDTGNYDYEVLTVDAMRALTARRQHPVFSVSSVKAWAEAVTERLAKSACFSGAVTIVLLCVILGRWKLYQLLLLMAEWLLCGGLWYASWCRMQAGASGGNGMCFLLAALCVLSLSRSEMEQIDARGLRLCVICAGILCLYFLRDERRSEGAFIRQRWNTNYGLLAQIRSDPEHFYFRKSGVLSYENCADPWQRNVTSVAYNTAFLGMEDLAPEDRMWLAQEYQVGDPWRDMIGNEKVLLIDDDIDQTLRYLRKQYGRKVRAEVVGTLDDRSVYRIR